MNAYVLLLHRQLNKTRALDFLAPLAFRLYLGPVFLAAGLHKLHTFSDTVAWLGDPEWGLSLPFPALLAVCVTAVEIGGGLALLIGLGVRWLAGPLMITMLVAALTVHWENGWFAIAPSNPATSTAAVLAEAGVPGARASLENSAAVGERLGRIKTILREHGDYAWLTEKGNPVILNNGIEFSATYFIMLLSLFFTGGGRFISLDYWIESYLQRRDARLVIAQPGAARG